MNIRWSISNGLKDELDLPLTVAPVRLEVIAWEAHNPMTIDNARTMACKLPQIPEKQQKWWGWTKESEKPWRGSFCVREPLVINYIPSKKMKKRREIKCSPSALWNRRSLIHRLKCRIEKFIGARIWKWKGWQAYKRIYSGWVWIF